MQPEICENSTLKDLKNAKNENYYFLRPLHFSLLEQIKTDGNDMLLLVVPNTGVLTTLASTSYASLVYYVLHVVSPRIKQNILSFHMLLVSIHK